MRSSLLRKGMAQSASAARASATGPRLVRQPVQASRRERRPACHGGALQVDLDGIALAHRGLDRRSAVLDDALGRIVQVRDGRSAASTNRARPWAWRSATPRYSTAKIASISTAAPSGRLAQPTAMRVWRPLLPEHLDHQLGGAVDHFGMIGEAWRRVDKAVEAQAAGRCGRDRRAPPWPGREC